MLTAVSVPVRAFRGRGLGTAALRTLVICRAEFPDQFVAPTDLQEILGLDHRTIRLALAQLAAEGLAVTNFRRVPSGQAVVTYRVLPPLGE